ncbi:hypothetical protein HMPREF0299_7280 [Corynebacterium matruchotii ATCC 14266]|uniref:Uncharacterized protein n=3 Tax=Corynebacterium matruchotii TaxID=43768 RepID=E0DE85_9CORY|nr:hypothetical protein HMPREF0299_7280 [Corynebacterium matruchotii ATCC 14266]
MSTVRLQPGTTTEKREWIPLVTVIKVKPVEIQPYDKNKL